MITSLSSKKPVSPRQPQSAPVSPNVASPRRRPRNSRGSVKNAQSSSVRGNAQPNSLIKSQGFSKFPDLVEAHQVERSYGSAGSSKMPSTLRPLPSIQPNGMYPRSAGTNASPLDGPVQYGQFKREVPRGRDSHVENLIQRTSMPGGLVDHEEDAGKKNLIDPAQVELLRQPNTSQGRLETTVKMEPCQVACQQAERRKLSLRGHETKGQITTEQREVAYEQTQSSGFEYRSHPWSEAKNLFAPQPLARIAKVKFRLLKQLVGDSACAALKSLESEDVTQQQQQQPKHHQGLNGWLNLLAHASEEEIAAKRSSEACKASIDSSCAITSNESPSVPKDPQEFSTPELIHENGEEVTNQMPKGSGHEEVVDATNLPNESPGVAIEEVVRVNCSEELKMTEDMQMEDIQDRRESIPLLVTFSLETSAEPVQGLSESIPAMKSCNEEASSLEASAELVLGVSESIPDMQSCTENSTSDAITEPAPTFSEDMQPVETVAKGNDNSLLDVSVENTKNQTTGTEDVLLETRMDCTKNSMGNAQADSQLPESSAVSLPDPGCSSQLPEPSAASLPDADSSLEHSEPSGDPDVHSSLGVSDMFSGKVVTLAAKQMTNFARKNKTEDIKEGNQTDDQTVTRMVSFEEAEKRTLRGFYDLHDADGSSCLNFDELFAVVDDIGKAPYAGTVEAYEFERLMRKADDGDGELNFDEFIAFLEDYYYASYVTLFAESDEDDSGTIAPFELKGLLLKMERLGFEISKDDMTEMFFEVDNKSSQTKEDGAQGTGDGSLDWYEFLDLMKSFRKKEFELLKSSAGFRGQQLEYLQGIYENGDEDGSGELGIKEVVKILEGTVSGAIKDQETIDKFVALFDRMDQDRSLTLDLEEFLRLVRVWSNSVGKQGGKEAFLDQVVKQQQDQSKTNDKDDSRIMQRVKTSMLVGDFSEETDADPDKLYETLRAIAVQNDVEDGITAKHNGIPMHEIQCLRDCFEFCDADGSGHIDSEELAYVLKTMGCAAITQAQKKAFAHTVKTESSQDLDFPFLVRFLVKYREACTDEILVSMESEEEKDGIQVDKLVQALYQFGQYTNRDGALGLLKRVGGDPESKVVDKETFLKLLALVHAEKIIQWRDTFGFSANQLAVIKHAFESQSDRDNSNIMNRDGRVINVLQVLNLAPPPDKRDALMKALLRVDRVCDGKISYNDFLLLVRHLENQKLYEKTREEKDKAKMAGLDVDAVQQLRQCFNDYEPDENGRMGFFKVQKIFSDLGLIHSSKERRRLQDVINEVAGEDRSVKFAQFLDILHRAEKAGIC
eukprot:gnl/MRDRNA2_/MRDRNA2_72050_c0_seq1.p1 gnl/MRDRNA2_/MRDRNA2_72050_c0~~gnl/MRDRNA2_/MRDRNA2_72050_c0_seq1.p1  ORF type:complete len:1298 (-),score=274.48 gnl/MRDRNA2_/MRDRNA2_72050_c0_seq1:262-4155(-)